MIRYIEILSNSIFIAITSYFIAGFMDIVMSKSLNCSLDDNNSLNNKENEFKLLILHVNDIHSRIQETSSSSAPSCRDEVCYGGFSRLKLVSQQLRDEYEKENWSVLFLNAGDNFQGSPYYSIHKWKVLSDLIPDLGFDVMSLGNHEFDDGTESLSHFLRNLKSPPVVGCNLDFSRDRFLQNISIAHSKVFTFRGIDVAVVGYITPDYLSSETSSNVSINDEIESLHSEVARLKASNVDIVIALGHSGYKMDKRIAREIPGIDLIVGGHSHSFLWNGTKPPSNDKISGDYPSWEEQISFKNGIQKKIKLPIVQAYAYTKYLGFLKLTFETARELNKTEGEPILHLKSATGNPILLSSVNFSEDLHMKTKIETWKTEVEKPVGETKLVLEGDASICRHRECNLGNLVVDAFVDYSVRYSTNISMIPVAFVHSGSIRANIDSPDGHVLYGDLLSVLPFSNQLIHVKLKGKHIYEIFEHSISGIKENLGRFLQVSGLKIKYNLSKPIGNRVMSILSRCKKCHSHYKTVLNDTLYDVITVEEFIKGADGYTEFKNYVNNDIQYFGVTDFETVQLYLKNHSPVYPELEGRIKFSKFTNDSESVKKKT